MSTQKIKQIIDEIKDLKNECTHRSALRIYNLLENNKKLFAEVVEQNDLNYLLNGFEDVSHQNPLIFSTGEIREQYNKLCENFLFHCGRVI